MQVKVKDIAKIQFGHYSALGKNEEIPYLQAKHFDDLGQFTYNCDTFLDENQVSSENILQRGDVLFVAKGFRFFAAAYNQDWGRTVPSSVFFVLKVDQTKVIPDYLAAVLNLPQTLTFFQQAASSSTIPSIRKKEVEDFVFNIPSLREQQKIATLKQLHLNEIKLTQQLINQKQNLIQAALQQLINQ